MAISRNGNQAKVHNVKGLKSWYVFNDRIDNSKTKKKVKAKKSGK